MAVSFLSNREISDLCLGKPPLNWWVSVDSKISEALLTLKRSGETHVSVWSCGTHSHSFPDQYSSCECVGKICMVDFVSFLCKEENMANPLKVFEEPVSKILAKGPPFTVRHLEPNSSLLEAIDCILEGVQNLIIPIDKFASRNARRKFQKQPSSFSYSLHNGLEYCWLTQEDVVRYLLNSIAVFSPFPTFRVESLKIIDQDIMTIHYKDPASSALSSISRAHAKQTSVAVIDENNRLIGEISPSNLACCDEAVAAAAITTLCAGDLMAYIDCGGPPDYLVHLVKTRLEERNLEAMVDLVEEYSMCSSASSCCSTDDDSFSSKSTGFSSRHFPGRRFEPIVCFPWSSLVAAMIQMLSHRATCIWVVEEDHTLVGLVTFEGILKVFRDTRCKIDGNNSSIQ